MHAEPVAAVQRLHLLLRVGRGVRDRAKLDLERTIVRASIGGTSVNVKLLPGEQVRAIERQPAGDYQRLSEQLNAIRAAEPGLIRNSWLPIFAVPVPSST